MSFFLNDTATTEIYALSLHDALPICEQALRHHPAGAPRGAGDHERLLRHASPCGPPGRAAADPTDAQPRSEEHTSELQSRQYLVCRLLLEKKNDTTSYRVSPFHNIHP